MPSSSGQEGTAYPSFLKQSAFLDGPWRTSQTILYLTPAGRRWFEIEDDDQYPEHGGRALHPERSWEDLLETYPGEREVLPLLEDAE